MKPLPTPWSRRVAACGLAMLVTGLGMSALLADITLRAPARTRPAVIYVSEVFAPPRPDPVDATLPAPPVPLPAHAMPRVEAISPASSARLHSAPRRGAASAAMREPASTAIAMPTADAASAPASDPIETHPLDLGADVMRSAARDSHSTPRRMADASGRAMGEAPRSRGEARSHRRSPAPASPPASARMRAAAC